MALSARELQDMYDGTRFSRFKEAYWQNYQDVWKFHQEFFVTMHHGHDDFWQVLERAMQEIREKHNNSPLVCELLESAYNELVRTWNALVEKHMIFGEKREAIRVEQA